MEQILCLVWVRRSRQPARGCRGRRGLFSEIPAALAIEPGHRQLRASGAHVHIWFQMCCDWGPLCCRGDAKDPLPPLPLTPVRNSARQFKFLWGSQVLTANLKPPSRHSHCFPLVTKRYFCYLQSLSSPHSQQRGKRCFPREVTQGWRCPHGTGVSSATSEDTAGLAERTGAGFLPAAGRAFRAEILSQFRA